MRAVDRNGARARSTKGSIDVTGADSKPPSWLPIAIIVVAIVVVLVVALR
jgi:hypothetical protein